MNNPILTLSPLLALAFAGFALPFPQAAPATPSPAAAGAPLADAVRRVKFAPGTQPNQPNKFTRSNTGFQVAAAEEDQTGGGFGFGGSGYAVSSYRSASGRDLVPPVVIQFANPDPVASQQLEEDLAIMSHLFDQALEKGLGEDTPPSRMGVPLLYTSGARSTRAVYVAGVGPVFMIKVNMPLMPPPSPEEEKRAQSAIDSDWEAARREVLGGPKGPALLVAANVTDTQFEAEQFEALKGTLVAALKNAANIRHLKTNDAVSIAVFGQPVPIATIRTSESRSNSEAASDSASASNKPSTAARTSKSSRRTSSRAAVVVGDASQPGSLALKGTVLTMQAKLADIHAFAHGKLALDDFASKVLTTAYAGSGYGITSVNSWIQTGRTVR